MGRPKLEETESGALLPAAGDSLDIARTKKRHRRQAGILARQRSDCKGLADIITETLKDPEAGAGPRGSVAAAIAALTRSLQGLHEMEKEAHDLGGGVRGVKAVILIPVEAKDMRTWSEIAKIGLGSGETPGEKLRTEREEAAALLELDIIGGPEPGEELTQEEIDTLAAEGAAENEAE